MKPLPLQDIIKQMNGQILHGKSDLLLYNVTQLKRNVRNHTLFFYKKQEKVEWSILNRYKNCVVVAQNPPGTPQQWGNVTIVKVPSYNQAYWDFVHYYRQQFAPPVCVITGTSGKTTVKEMIKHILSLDHKVVSTRRSQNHCLLNLLYLTAIDESTQAVVIEAGVAAPGELLDSCRHFQPTIGILTNISIDHIQGCGTFENYIQAKAELVTGLNNQGTLLLNGDDPNIAKIDTSHYGGKLLTFGQKKGVDYRVSKIQVVEGGIKFVVKHRESRVDGFIPEYGVHNVYNALAAIAGAHIMGVSLPDAAKRLRTFRNLQGHVTVFTGLNGATVIDDTWKATPASMEAGITTLTQVGKGKRKVIVTGRMASELMEYKDQEYQRIGKLIATAGIDVLITRGEEGGMLAQTAQEAGMNTKQIIACPDDFDEVFRVLLPYLDSNTVVLIKSSWSDPSKPLLQKLRDDTNQ